MNNSFNRTVKSQNGIALVVSLVILTLVTIIGLASMRNSNLELKMAASTRDHSIAFQNAESALHFLEKRMSADSTAYLRQSVNGCATEGCFTSTCNQGLCFSGSFSASDLESQCSLGLTPRQYWKEEGLWGDEAAYGTIDIPDSKTPNTPGTENEVKYMVEFLCFAADPYFNTLNKEGKDPMLPVYRLTVRAEGEAGRSTSVLQSVYRGKPFKRSLADIKAGIAGGEPAGDSDEAEGGGGT